MTKPAWVCAEVSAIWDEIALMVRPAIGPVGMEALCTQIRRMRDAAKRIEAEGLVVADPRGNPVAHPGIVVEKGAQAEVRRWLSDYGSHEAG